MVVFNPLTVLKTCVFLASIQSAIATSSNAKVVYARDGRNSPNDIASLLRLNHIEAFCTTWLGITPATTTKTTTQVTTVQATQTVNTVSTVLKGTTTLTSGVTVTKTEGSKTQVTVTSLVTKLMTSYSTDLAATTVITPVETRTVTTAVSTATVTSILATTTSATTTTAVSTVSTTTTTTITATFGSSPTVKKKRDTGPQKRGRRQDVPDCIKYAPDDLISAGCSLIVSPQTVTKTVTTKSTLSQGTKTITAYGATTTVPANTKTITSTSIVKVQSPITVQTTVVSTVVSTTVSTISSRVTTTVPSTVTQFVSVTTTTTIPSTSVVITTTTTTTTTSAISTQTVSRCPAPSRVPGSFGLGVDNPGNIEILNGVARTEDCCLACFDPSRYPGCVAWVSGPSAPGSSDLFCFLVDQRPGTPPNTATCPFGLGTAFILADASDPTSDGGPGPCAAPGGIKVN